jgi:hypothetical protein
MEQVYLRYPDDREAAVFYALALDATALPTDKTYANHGREEYHQANGQVCAISGPIPTTVEIRKADVGLGTSDGCARSVCGSRRSTCGGPLPTNQATSLESQVTHSTPELSKRTLSLYS